MPIRDPDSIPSFEPKRAPDGDEPAGAVKTADTGPWLLGADLPSIPTANGNLPPVGLSDLPPVPPAIIRTQMVLEPVPDANEMSYRPTVDAAERTTGTMEKPPEQRPTRPVTKRELAGTVLAGKYELGTRLGVGGMGEVYRASHLTLGVQVAVKIMHPHIAVVDDYMRRFRREAHAASLLQHRNVVRVLDFGEDDGVLYLVMELLRGESLNRWLGRSVQLPTIAACTEILLQVLDAFEAAHTLGIVHRDLKPENIFLADEPDGKRIPKVVDFGLAHVDDHRDTGPTLTNIDAVSGTPEYMSPEQCRSLAVGPSTDIYAIGCLLTDMLQRTPPFMGNAVEVMTQQMFVPPPPLKRPPGSEPIPPLLERLRLSLLAKSPDQRPQDAREVKRLLLEATSPEATAQRLPARKNEAPATGRGEAGRAPLMTAPLPAAGATLSVGLTRLASREDGFGTSCATGLAAQGIIVVEPAAGQETAIQVAVLDAGADVESAAAWLRQKSVRVPVVVCLSEVTTDRMNTLIAAGAKDIVPYPVTSDVVAKKVRRAARAR